MSDQPAPASTPIPAGVLTVDDEPTWPGGKYRVRCGEQVVMLVTAEERARLLSPPRPTGVPDDAVPVTMWVGREEEDGFTVAYTPDGPNIEFLGSFWRQRGVPVPPYQPTTPAATCVACGGYGHDPVECASDDDHERERRDHPCAACQPTPPEPTACLRCNGRGRVPDSIYEVSVVCPACDGSRVQPTPPEPAPAGICEPCSTGLHLDCTSDNAHCLCRTCWPLDRQSEPPVSEVRTGPLGLSEQETQDVAAWQPISKPGDLHATTRDNTIAACRAAVAEWDAEDTPATPDPEALLVEKIAADWTTPDPADSPNAPPVAGERTGPLGLSESDTRKIARQNTSWADLAIGTGTLARQVWNATQEACRAAAAEWDAQPEPAETLADIAAECDGWTDNKWFDDPRSFIYYIHQIAERVKAAQKREREKIEAATRAAPATIPVNRDDLRTVIDASSRAVDRNAAYVRLRAALAAAGLPQEPTEPEPTEPEAQR